MATRRRRNGALRLASSLFNELRDSVFARVRHGAMRSVSLKVLEHLHSTEAETLTVMITAYATVDTAVQALKEGAQDYVTKPIDPDDLDTIRVLATVKEDGVIYQAE